MNFRPRFSRQRFEVALKRFGHRSGQYEVGRPFDRYSCILPDPPHRLHEMHGAFVERTRADESDKPARHAVALPKSLRQATGDGGWVYPRTGSNDSRPLDPLTDQIIGLDGGER